MIFKNEAKLASNPPRIGRRAGLVLSGAKAEHFPKIAVRRLEQTRIVACEAIQDSLLVLGIFRLMQRSQAEEQSFQAFDLRIEGLLVILRCSGIWLVPIELIIPRDYQAPGSHSETAAAPPSHRTRGGATRGAPKHQVTGAERDDGGAEVGAGETWQPMGS